MHPAQSRSLTSSEHSATSRARPSRCRRRPVDHGAPRPSELLAVFFVAGIAFLIAGAAAGIGEALTDHLWLHWVALHLVFLGGVSQLVLGAGQFFTCAFLATSPPSRRVVGLQLGVWNAGVVLVAVGVPTGWTPLVDIGGALIVTGLVLFAGALRAMQRRSLQQARWAVRWYMVSAASLGVGALLGIAMARGTAWSHGSLLGAHLALNVGGWMGTAIVGTLHTFFPSLTQTRLRLPRLQGPTFVLWVSGVWALAVGAAFGVDALVITGWVALGAAASLLSVNLLASLRGAPVALALPARLIALAQAFLPIGIGVALGVTLIRGAQFPFAGSARSPLAALLLIGWVGLTVAGALLHLLAVLARVRHFAVAIPGPRPARDRMIVAAACAAVAGLALGHQAGLELATVPALALTLAVAVVLSIRIGALLVCAMGSPARRRTGTRSA